MHHGISKNINDTTWYIAHNAIVHMMHSTLSKRYDSSEFKITISFLCHYIYIVVLDTSKSTMVLPGSNSFVIITVPWPKNMEILWYVL